MSKKWKCWQICQISGAYAFFSSFSTVHESRIKRGSKKFTEEPQVSLYENKVFSNTILSAHMTVYNLICRSPLMEIRLLNSPWAKDLLACLVTFTQRKHHDIPPDIYMRYIMKLNLNCHDISLQFSEIIMSEGPGGENSGNIIVIHPGSLYLRFPSQYWCFMW